MSDPFPYRALSLPRLSQSYRKGEVSPVEVAREVLRRISESRERYPSVFIQVEPEERLLAAAERLHSKRNKNLPLYGVPFAVKDNIDVAGIPTTAACPALTRTPSRGAPVVERLIDAGALFVGKTNLDQLAMGLVGARSPYGAVGNAFDPAYISGGSSAGSAVAVALGLVSFALGTDTAGSGRVPAGFNNIVGLKPSRGLLSTTGLVPACRSLDCVSVFSFTVEDACAVANVAKGYDPSDPYSHAFADTAAFTPHEAIASFRFGIPKGSDLEFFGDAMAERAFSAALDRLERAGGRAVEVDFTAFRETARLLYEGPWVAERLISGGELLESQPDALLPVIRDILSQGREYDAAAAFRGTYRLNELRRITATVWDAIDVLVVPTAPTIYKIEQVLADPLRLNAHLGAYTNFVNLLDLSALAVPAGFRADGLPAGITLIAPHGQDARLASLGSGFHRSLGLPLGATGELPGDRWPILVVGAHLSGLALNGQLRDAGASLIRACRTAPQYRLYALPETTPPKPGMVRVAPGEQGHAIEAEVWSIPLAAFGAFVASVRSPLSIGTVLLDDGTTVQGFLCEPYAVLSAKEISEYGGFRAYLRSMS